MLAQSPIKVDEMRPVKKKLFESGENHYKWLKGTFTKFKIVYTQIVRRIYSNIQYNPNF